MHIRRYIVYHIQIWVNLPIPLSSLYGEGVFIFRDIVHRCINSHITVYSTLKLAANYK